MELLLVVLLILLNGFFVAAEFALVRARAERLAEEAEQGNRSARRLQHQLERIDRYLSGCQAGITIASLGLGAVGEPYLSDLLEPVFGGFLSHGLAVAIGTVLAFTLITIAHLTAGEQAPKMLAITRAERVGKFVSLPLQLFTAALFPLVWTINTISNGMVRLIGIRQADYREVADADDIRLLIREVGGKLDRGEVQMLSGVFEMHEQEAHQVMTPIPAVVCADVDDTVKTALRKGVESGHTRLLVIEDKDEDRVRGIVHTNGLAELLMTEGPDASIEPVIREVPFVPETRSLDDLLADLKDGHSSMAVVMDEYGRTEGIVTVEDIIEEIVGEIDDETDARGGPDIRDLGGGVLYVRGHVSLADLEDAGVKLPVDSDDYNSIGGFVFGELGRLPRRGDEVTSNGYLVRVESVRDNRIDMLRISGRPQPPGESEPAEAPQAG